MKKFLTILLLLLVAVFAVYLVLPPYLKNALTYYNADIDDYTIFENRPVMNAGVQPWAEGEAYNKQTLADSLEIQMEALNPVAFLVSRHGQLVYEQYWGDYNAESYSNSFSMAKSIIGLLTGIALQEGHIKSLDEPAGNYLPPFNKGANKTLTIRDLLTMSSGLNWDESYGSPFSITTKAYYGEDLPALIDGLEVIETPGKRWEYLSGNTQVLARILEEATGQRVSEYASEKLWKPLGTSSPALWSLDEAEGTEKAYCCFNSNARDFARLGQLVLNGGRWNDTTLIGPAFLEEALQPATYLTDNAGEPVDFYGYQWWIVNYKGKQIPYARGILGQYIFILQDKDAVAVRLGHNRSPDYIGHHPKDVYLYLDAAYSLLP
jgi:CubicO group peptidase (beta-lactamase class C family)